MAAMTETLLCKHFPACSGCGSIGTPYTEQLAAKLRAVRDVFAKAGLTDFDPASIQRITPSPLTAGYRNRVKLVPSIEPATNRNRPDPSVRGHRDQEAAGWHQNPGRQGGAPVHEEDGGINLKSARSLGLYRAGTHEVVDIPGCPVQGDAINRVVEAIRAGLSRFDVQLYDEVAHHGDLRFVTVRQGSGTGEMLVGFVTREDAFPGGDALAEFLMERGQGVVGVVQNVNPEKGNVIFGRTSRRLAGRDFLEEIVCGVRIRLGVTSFFQINTQVAEAAYRAMVRYLISADSAGRVDEGEEKTADPCVEAGASDPPQPSLVQGGEEKGGGDSVDSDLADSAAVGDAPHARTTLLDLYAGVGTIGLVAARNVRNVIGIEEVAEAVEHAGCAAAANGIANVRFEQGRVERRLSSLVNELRAKGVGPDEMAVAVNPPRKGLAGGVGDMLTAASPERIAYLSCNPVTLARDLVRFERGGYRVARVELFDMFPQTEQVETLAMLTR